MRRWVCIVALLAGFSADGYAYTVRSAQPGRRSSARSTSRPTRAAREARPDLTGRRRGGHRRRGPDLIDRTSTRRRGPVRRIAGVAGAILVVASVARLASASATAAPSPRRRPTRSGSSSARPTTLDPAAQGDIGSAAVSAQLFEGLTAFDPQLNVRPALAESWDLLDGGRRIVFHLRPDLTFSRRLADHRRRRRPELAPDHRPDAPVAARVA